MKGFIITLILLLAYSVIEKPSVSEIANIADPSKFIEIDYEKILKNKKVVRLSQVASNIQYIRLETNPSCLLYPRSPKYFFVDSLIFVQNVNHILKFSLDGKFIKKIGTSGRGPGEIPGTISNLTVLTDKRLLVIFVRDRFMFFSFNGDLLKTVKIPYHQEAKVLNDSRYIAYDPSTMGSERYNFILASAQGDTISTVKNYTTWERVLKGTISIRGASEAFYWYRNSFFFKSDYNDTVYYVNSAKDKIEPSYRINLGKYKLPDELIPGKIQNDPIKMQRYKEKAINYYSCKPFEASNKIFLRTSCYGKPDIKYIIYDRDKAEGYLLVNESGESTGLINDWDGGLDFWPIGQKGNNQIIMPISITDFKKKINNTKLDGRINKYPEKQKALENMISDSDDLDNPIIMVITLRNKFIIN